jgi:trehalose synthase
LLPDPGDLEAFGAAARLLLGDPGHAAQLGKPAHAHVREQYVGDMHLLRYARLLATLIGHG